MTDASALKRGYVIQLDGQLFQVVECQLISPGNWRAFLDTKLKNLVSGGVVSRRFRTNERVEVQYLERKEFQYLYREGANYVFMDMESFEQHFVSEDLLGDAKNYLLENMTVIVEYCNGKPMNVIPPASVDLRVVETPAAVKGATVTNQSKPATLETGLVVQVPPFVEAGELVTIDTREGKYLSRAGK